MEPHEGTIVRLKAPHPSRSGRPVITHVHTEIFTKRYFTECLRCDFCGDACCASGVDIDVENVGRLEAVADEFEAFLGIPRDRWFTGTITEDVEFPSARHTRTQVIDGSCVFHDRSGRGCLIHRFSVREGRDYHDLKPMVSCLFPITFRAGVLRASDEIADGTLVCLDQGPTLYAALRDELRYYFGATLIEELDGIAADVSK